MYDAFGRRQRKTIDGTITDFVYDGLNPVRQAVGASTVDLLTGLGIDEYLMRTDASSSRNFLGDALGSTVSLSDSSGTIQTEYIYEPFGTATFSGSTSTNELRYTGREDDGTSLNYYRARYYHPALQRFIAEDPIGFAGGDPNLYGYVANSPTNFTDSTGLAVDPVSLTAVGIMCGSGAVVGAVLAGRKATWSDRVQYAGVGCGVGMLTLVSWIAAGGTAVAGAVAMTSDTLAATAAASVGAATALGRSSGLGANPFKGKTAREVVDALTRKGYIPTGPNPGAGRGTFVNPRTGRGYHIDASHPLPKGPHVGVHRPRDLRDIMTPRDYPMGGP